MVRSSFPTTTTSHCCESRLFMMKWKIFGVRDWQTYFLRKNDFPPPRRAKISWWFIVDTVGILKAIKIISRFRRLRRMCLACLNSSLVDERRSIKIAICILFASLFCRSAIFTSRWRRKVYWKGISRRGGEKLLKELTSGINWCGKQEWSWMVRRSHRNRAKNKPRLSSAFGEIRAEQRKKKKLICGWFYSQKTSKAKMESCLCKGWIYATRMNIVLVK